ncbi:Zinc finger HIT-type [Penicillium herquei]|nr:Zinc finger HIT-type [Penicillium herquei]
MTVRSKIFLPLRARVGARSFSSSRPRWEGTPLPARKPVGAFRGGLFGFLSGAVVAGASVYFYILSDYRVANEMLTDDISIKGSAPTPGWTYVADRAFNPAQAAMAPTLSRKRGIRDAGKGGDMSSRRANAIIRHLAELDRENQRDVSIPVPVKQAKEAGARGTRAKTTSNVRRILQSQKSFRNHLDDEEAALSNAAASGAGSGVGIWRLRGIRLSAAKKKRVSTVGATGLSNTTTAAASPAPTATPMEVDEEDEERKHKLLKTEHDNDPLLRSYAPNMPSDRVIQRLLAEPPLSYNASRAGPPNSSRLPRHFCCMCGYWGKIRCKNCHVRTCGLDCYRVHEDSRCGAFF